MRANIKIKFTNSIPDPNVHFTLDQVYQALAINDAGSALPIFGLVLNDIGALKNFAIKTPTYSSDFELVSVTIPGDDVQLYP